jgi:hypothetical protein
MTVRTQSDDMMKELEEQVAWLEESSSDTTLSLAEAIRAFMTAMEYDDPALRDSSLETTKQCFIDFAEERISNIIKQSKSSLEFCENCIADIAKQVISPNHRIDELGEKLQELAQLNLRRLTRFQSNLQRAFGDITLSGSGPLQNEIKRWRDFEDSYLKQWPWTSRKRSPVNRELLAKSKQSRERGETGISAEDLINRLNANDGSWKPG